MNSSSLNLITYYTLAKELIGIKNSTHPLKYSPFTQQSQWLGKKEERKGTSVKEKKQGKRRRKESRNCMDEKKKRNKGKIKLRIRN